MSFLVFTVVLYLLPKPCLSSLSNPILKSNNSKTNTTNKPLIVTTASYYNLCNNITSCEECGKAKDLYNTQCSWIEYTNNPNYTSKCIETNECQNDDIECCTTMTCCNCLAQSSCKRCGSQGLNATCLWDHTHRTCFTPNHTCSGHFSIYISLSYTNI